jgi:HEPN domain-containing protein
MKDGRNEIAIKRLNLAKRYLENAKENLKKAGIDRKVGEYIDVKYVSSACGKAYLSALEALKALFINEGLLDEKEIKGKLKKVDMYDNFINELSRLGKNKDIIKKLFNHIYDILHLGGYYRELQSKKAIDDGFEKVEKIIKIVESYIK